MHQPSDQITARFEFKPDRASDFLMSPDQLITQIEFPADEDGIDELTAYIDQFADAIVDVNAIVNGSVLTLADFR